MLRFSNNYIADVLTMDMAASVDDHPPQALASAGQLLSDFVQRVQARYRPDSRVPPPIYSGSGLTTDNRLSANDLVRLLAYQYHDARRFPAFYGGLVVPRDAPFVLSTPGRRGVARSRGAEDRHSGQSRARSAESPVICASATAAGSPLRRSSTAAPIGSTCRSSRRSRPSVATSNRCSRDTDRLQGAPIDKPTQNPPADHWGERMPRSLGPMGRHGRRRRRHDRQRHLPVPATVAAQLHAPGPAMLCWLIGGLVSLCGALSVAELGAALPRSGGIFAYLLECFGPVPAFLYGWACLTVITPAALGATRPSSPSISVISCRSRRPASTTLRR